MKDKNMNEEAFTDDDTNEITNSMSAWNMAISLLVGLRQTVAKAEVEYAQRLADAKGNSFGQGVSPAAHLLEALKEAQRGLEPDLRQIARSNDLALPE
jgi:hypothetical protein